MNARLVSRRESREQRSHRIITCNDARTTAAAAAAGFPLSLPHTHSPFNQRLMQSALTPTRSSRFPPENRVSLMSDLIAMPVMRHQATSAFVCLPLKCGSRNRNQEVDRRSQTASLAVCVPATPVEISKCFNPQLASATITRSSGRSATSRPSRLQFPCQTQPRFP